MTSECSKHQERIPRSCVGDLTAEEQQALNSHLAACPPCREEHDRYAETLRLLLSAGDEPIPRHFFVYPNEHVSNPWQLFRQLVPRWQAVTAGIAGLFVFLGIATVSGLQIRSDHGAWAMTFGRGSAPAGIDVAALRADILRTADENNRAAAIGWIQDLRSEMANSRSDLTQQQQYQLTTALTGLENRVNNRVTATADELRAGSQKSFVDLYQVVSSQREQDLNDVNTRLDKVVENNESRARQTDAILDTLLQIANLNLKQPGDQK